MDATSGIGPLGALAVGLLLAGCSVSRVENGVFYSSKGYHVRLPSEGWRVERTSDAELQLSRATPAGGMLVNATCEGKPLDEPLPLLMRHLTFGLRDRRVIEHDSGTFDGTPREHMVLRGTMDGRHVAVEAVIVKTDRCVHDFLYVAPAADFDAGRSDFEAFVKSFARDGR